MILNENRDIILFKKGQINGFRQRVVEADNIIRACNFFPIWLKMLILFLNEVDIQLILEFKKKIWKNLSRLS